MAQVFVSYTHKDVEQAERVQSLLEENGHRVWRDAAPGGIRPGDSIPSMVAGGLDDSDYLLLIITKHSVTSSWMRQEVNTFLMDRSKWDRIIPLRFDSTEIKSFHGLLEQVKYANFRDFEKGSQELLERLGKASQERDEPTTADHERLITAIDLALRCGNVAMRYYNSSIVGNYSLDDRRNATTIADKAAQHEFFRALRTNRAFDDDIVVGEESGDGKSAPAREGYTWVVDPLDGTMNFENRIPLFCSAVGVLRNRKPYIGAIYAPVTSEVYFALDGAPAKVWHVRRGEVRAIAADQEANSLRSCVVATHISSRSHIAAKSFEGNQLETIAANTRGVRTLGSGLLALAYVASGRLQAFFQYGSYLWDQAAGVVLVNNSGSGTVRRISSGRDWTFTTRDLVAASNNTVADKLLAILGRS